MKETVRGLYLCATKLENCNKTLASIEGIRRVRLCKMSQSDRTGHKQLRLSSQ